MYETISRLNDIWTEQIRSFYLSSDPGRGGGNFLVYYLPLTNMKLLLLLALATVVRGHGNMVKPLAIWDEQQGTIHFRRLQSSRTF